MDFAQEIDKVLSKVSDTAVAEALGAAASEVQSSLRQLKSVAVTMQVMKVA